MTDLEIRYPWGNEPMTGEEVAPGVYRLTSFSMFMPLAPKDQVVVEDGFVTGVHELAELFIGEAHFKFHTPESVLEEAVDEWSMATDAVMSTALTVRVASGSRQWLQDVVEAHPRVETIILERVPSQEFDWDAAIEEA